MELYFKILSLIKPYWKHVVVVFFLTIFYVLFNNLSLWISVDFVQELFDPTIVETEIDADKTADEQAKGKYDKIKELIAGDEKEGIYIKAKTFIKSLIIQENRYDTLLVVCFVIFLTFLLKNIVHLAHQLILEVIQLNIITTIRVRLHKSLLMIPISFYHKRHTGDLTSIAFNDVHALNQVLNASFSKMIISPVQIITNIIILFSISVKLSLITLTIIPVTAFIMVKIGQSMRRKSRRVFQQISNVVTSFQESVSAVKIVKAFTNEEKEIKNFKDANREWYKKTFREHKLNYMTSPMNEMMYVTLVAVLLWYGGSLVYSHTDLTAEDFLRFLIFLFTMIQPIKDLSGVNNTIQTGMAAGERIFGILESEKEIYDKPGSIEIEEFKDRIEFKNVDLQYDSVETEVLKNVNLTIKKGEMAAIVGHSGAGKTSLINLLPRFYKPTRGAIYIDGNNIEDIKLQSLREKMSIVTQDTILFNDSLRMNIGYGLENVSDDDIIHAARSANAWEFIKKMKDGLDTHIGEKGVRLSGGQKQRISIARAILKNPPILILDEATSSLDTESEKLVQKAVDKLLKHRTVLVIAHRLSTIQNATKIVVLHEGCVNAIGNHKELLETNMLYKNLYENQILNQFVQT
ncbi:MAG: ABC transporter ATP-binding protein [Calditrichaceae bacterium]|nr:ABC transporter ATP-binding protein [Calditrichaceae bacterium]MBN2710343.1 ABC transporter ATP-binding protein [Calditrichaceae bacterium]RQV95093.1 MAG: ABC transporter ATP-binding protein [Calditrichota bacterium]